MKILIDVTHPAHVHFFKGAAKVWQEHGHQVKFVAREKEMTTQLLDEYKIPFQTLSKIRKGLFGLAVELIEHQGKLLKVIRDFHPDVMLNIGGTFIVHVGKLMGVKTCVFTDTEHAKLSNGITFPFATYICTPESYTDDLGEKHHRYKGYQELSYLHPNQFSPNPEILTKLGIQEGERFFLLRFVSWGASHDVGQEGISDQDKLRLVEELKKEGRVLISSEMPLSKDLEPFSLNISPIHIHDLLYYASMYIGEGATMASEAAILGTPSVYVNPLRSGNLREIINDYKLIYHITNKDNAIERIFSLAKEENLKQKHKIRRQQMLKINIDVTQWMVDFIESL
jgi:predicted glycosyltransferase